jgi:riboflavin biosynthesis pyrimidine reductase
LIVTTTSAPIVPVESIRAGSNAVDLPAIIGQLPVGIVHVEGGPQLNAALLQADVVDAINLTVSPHLSGHRAASLSAAPHALRQFSLVDFRREDDFVFVRYERNRNAQ